MVSIFLIGYMGAGKTTIGKRLAKELNMQFIDIDIFIENRYRKTINQLFAEKGEDGFRSIERKALEELSGFEDAIISTGGGLPCFYDNMKLMNSSGFTVYLKASEEELTSRLINNKYNRPLVKDKNKQELQLFIAENLKKREPFYNQANLIFDTEKLLTNTDVDNLVVNLIVAINEKSRKINTYPSGIAERAE